jgi:hypothetical protein
MKPQETGEVALPPKQYDSDSGVRGDTEQSNVPRSSLPEGHLMNLKQEGKRRNQKRIKPNRARTSFLQ